MPAKQGNLVVLLGEKVMTVAIVLGIHVDTPWREGNNRYHRPKTHVELNVCCF